MSTKSKLRLATVDGECLPDHERLEDAAAELKKAGRALGDMTELVKAFGRTMAARVKG